MRILVIDDEKTLADTLVLVLQNAGYDAIAAYDGAAVLSQIKSLLPDVVICDVLMRGWTASRFAAGSKPAIQSAGLFFFQGRQLQTA